MNKKDEFPFVAARRITASEVRAATKAVKEQFGITITRGRPSKIEAEKCQAVSIRLHPDIIAWAKEEAKKKKIGYQTVINKALLDYVTRSR